MVSLAFIDNRYLIYRCIPHTFLPLKSGQNRGCAIYADTRFPAPSLNTAPAYTEHSTLVYSRAVSATLALTSCTSRTSARALPTIRECTALGICRRSTQTRCGKRARTPQKDARPDEEDTQSRRRTPDPTRPPMDAVQDTKLSTKIFFSQEFRGNFRGACYTPINTV